MSKKVIEKNLVKALLHDGEMEYALFEYELEEHLDEYLKSKKKDKDDYFFVVTEHTNCQCKVEMSLDTSPCPS